MMHCTRWAAAAVPRISDSGWYHSGQYVAASDRLMAILAEEGLARLKSVTPKTVATPCGTFEGLAAPATNTICGVDIVRSGGILLEAVRKIAPDSTIARKTIVLARSAICLATYSPPRLSSTYQNLHCQMSRQDG